MKCADVAKEFLKKMEFFRNSDLIDARNLFKEIDKFKACEDFPGEPEKFEEILDWTEYSPVMPDRLHGKKWRVTFEEMPE